MRGIKCVLQKTTVSLVHHGMISPGTCLKLTHWPLEDLNEIWMSNSQANLSWVTSCEIPLSWISLNLTDDKSTLVQVMACCRQATSHYLNQCWPRFMSLYGITRPQWVNVMRKERLRQRKRDKKAAARYWILYLCCRIPLKRKAWIPAGVNQAPALSSMLWRLPGHHQLPGTRMWTLNPENVPRRTPRGGNEDKVGRWTDKGVTAGTVLTRVSGMSVTVTGSIIGLECRIRLNIYTLHHP